MLTSSLRSAFHVSYAACMRTHTPAPSPNNLPSRTAMAGDTGLRSRNSKCLVDHDLANGAAAGNAEHLTKRHF